MRTHDRVSPNRFLTERTLDELVSGPWREEGEEDDADPAEKQSVGETGSVL
jgi:hypothetical protein